MVGEVVVFVFVIINEKQEQTKKEQEQTQKEQEQTQKEQEGSADDVIVTIVVVAALVVRVDAEDANARRK